MINVDKQRVFLLNPRRPAEILALLCAVKWCRGVKAERLGEFYRAAALTILWEHSTHSDAAVKGSSTGCTFYHSCLSS